MHWSECQLVESTPGKVSIVPLLRGTRVQADTILESYELGESIEEIAYSFELNPANIRALLQYASSRQLAKSAT